MALRAADDAEPRSVVLRIARKVPFSDAPSAQTSLQRMLQVVREHIPNFCAYCATSTTSFHLTPTAVPRFLSECRVANFGVPTRYTHMSPLFTTADQRASTGGLSVAIGEAKGRDSGVRFVLRVDAAIAERVDGPRLIDACATLDIDEVDWATRRWVRGQGPSDLAPEATAPVVATRPPSREELRQLIHEATLPIEVYARIRATVAVAPDEEDAAWCAAGLLDAISRRDAEARMGTAFAANPTTFAAFSTYLQRALVEALRRRGFHS